MRKFLRKVWWYLSTAEGLYALFTNPWVATVLLPTLLGSGAALMAFLREVPWLEIYVAFFFVAACVSVLGRQLLDRWEATTDRHKLVFQRVSINPVVQNGQSVPYLQVSVSFLNIAKWPRGAHHKMKIMTLVDRDTGRAKSVVVDDLKRDTFKRVIEENMSREAVMVTDEYRAYRQIAGEVAAEHHSVNHSAGEYGRGTIHTNTVEGFYSIFKRGMKGVYQHCGKQHLHRYAAEFDFRYNHRVGNGVEDAERSQIALRGVLGKRLTYARPDL